MTESAMSPNKALASLRSRWFSMINRCANPNNVMWHRYGGRGICVCDSWQKFDNFVGWAVNNGFHPRLTLERVDNDLGYSPDNCIWADRQTQMQNTCRTGNYSMLDAATSRQT